MAIQFYIDHNVPRAITQGLRLRHVDALTAYEDGSHKLEDHDLLDRATRLGRAIFTQDDDFLALAANRQATGASFSGVVFAHQLYVPIGVCIDDLELIALAGNPADLDNQVIYLPL
jgi:hypothetical protein